MTDIDLLACFGADGVFCGCSVTVCAGRLPGDDGKACDLLGATIWNGD
jgi:hypothetical protein